MPGSGFLTQGARLYWFQSVVSVQFSSVAQSCLTLCDPMDCVRLPRPSPTLGAWSSLKLSFLLASPLPHTATPVDSAPSPSSFIWNALKLSNFSSFSYIFFQIHFLCSCQPITFVSHLKSSIMLAFFFFWSSVSLFFRNDKRWQKYLDYFSQFIDFFK